jgi:hypothetical protein
MMIVLLYRFHPWKDKTHREGNAKPLLLKNNLQKAFAAAVNMFEGPLSS